MGFVDLHCHPLPGVDDGVQSAEEGAALLAGLRSIGFETVVATPHVRSGLWDNRLSTRAAALAVLAPALDAAKARGTALPELLLAGEHMFDDVLHGLLQQGEALTYPGGGAALVEFPYDALPMRADFQLWRMGKGGVRPVVAHPERYTPVQQSDETMEQIAGAGAWALLDVMSLVGAYGRRAQATAERLVDQRAYVAACSDAHKPSDVPVVREAIEVLRRRMGDAEVERLLTEGPRKVLAAGRREAGPAKGTTQQRR